MIGNLLRAMVGPGGRVTGPTNGPSNVTNARFRVLIANIIAGATLVAAISGYKLRMIGCKAIAIGGAAAAVTTVDILGTQGAASVKLSAFAQASLTQSTVLTAGGSGSTVLADGASFAPCDVNTPITIGETGSSITTATAVDIIIEYVAEL